MLPLLEAFHSFLAKLSEAFLCLFYRLFPVEMGFAEELVGIANHFFLHGFWQEILMRKRQILFLDLLAGDASAGMSFAHAGVSFISFLAQQFRPQSSMTDIGLRAEALDARSVGQEDSDVVKHRRFLYKLGVEMQFGMRRNNL